MGKYLGEGLTNKVAQNRLYDAIDAVTERALDAGDLYRNVIADQLLAVAAKIMLEQKAKADDGRLEAWCEENIKFLKETLRQERTAMDGIMAMDVKK